MNINKEVLNKINKLKYAFAVEFLIMLYLITSTMFRCGNTTKPQHGKLQQYVVVSVVVVC